MRYLTSQEILALHDLLLEKSGGSHGVRDLGLLESAAERPKTQIAGQDMFQGVYEKAAAYLDSIVRNHMFVDGNKRSAFECAAAFLHLNGYEFSASNAEVVRFMVYAAESKPEISEIAKWLKENSAKVDN